MDVRLPRLGEGANSGVVATIFVKEGDQVAKDQPILELESEKAVASIPAPAAGTVGRIFVKEGDEIKVGAMLISIAEGGGSTAQPAPGTPMQAPPPASIDVHPEPSRVQPAPPPPAVSYGPANAAFPIIHPEGTVPPASPSLRKMARELGVDLSRVQGSERGGRIVTADVRAYVQRLQAVAFAPPAAAGVPGTAVKPAAPSIDFTKWGPVNRKKLSLLRKAIGTKMVESWTTVPHITQFDEADITDLNALRKKYVPRYKEKGGHLTLTPFILKALVRTLKAHPIFNASIDEAAGELVFKDYYHIGIAVDTEQGLIVPVLRDVNTKSLLELSSELPLLAERTRERKVALDEMQGGSFTISNQGGIGSGHFTPIINTPEVAILGVARGTEKLLLRGKEFVQRSTLPLTLSYDHRVIDGADAARFMVDLVKALEEFPEADVKL
jgi:pyruvate dehydrogenase E2 component (dihydrolipoamide acetyltransferase)